jgi:hypothetical protein
VITTGNLQKYGISGEHVGCFMSGKAKGMLGVQKLHPSILAHVDIVSP